MITAAFHTHTETVRLYDIINHRNQLVISIIEECASLSTFLRRQK